MKAGYGHWAIVILVVFTASVLGFAKANDYNLIGIDDDLIASTIKIGCSQKVFGTAKPKTEVKEATLVLTLDYSVNGKADERSLVVRDQNYAFRIRGNPDKDQIWTIHGYYYDKTGQLAETAEQFASVGCNQTVESNLEL